MKLELAVKVADKGEANHEPSGLEIVWIGTPSSCEAQSTSVECGPRLVIN